MKLKDSLIRRASQRADAAAEKKLRANQPLWKELEAYLAKTDSTGCSYAIYAHLYDYVRRHRPREILECGTGVSTLILAQAVLDNEADDGIKGRITSMEESSHWYQLASQLLPECYRSVVDIVHSPKVEDHYSLFHGVRYEEIPELDYDLVFVDGPDPRTNEGIIVCNLDYIKIVSKTKKPVAGLVQGRLINVYVYQKVFGLEKVHLDFVSRFTQIQPCGPDDLNLISGGSSAAFTQRIQSANNPEIYLQMESGAYCRERQLRRYQKKELPYQKQEE